MPFKSPTFSIGLCGNLILTLFLTAFSEPAGGDVPWRPKPIDPHGALDADCGDCHSPYFWTPVKKKMDFDHSRAGFPLDGAHLSSSCSDCHKDLMFSHVSSACADCHEDVHQGKFGMDCDVCHSTSRWQIQIGATETKAHVRFPLVGYHANLECGQCHEGTSRDKYAKVSMSCNDCHMKEYNNASDPNHLANGFNARCEDCHFYPASEGWSRTRYGHPADFPLDGKHRALSCKGCHQQGYDNTPTDCQGCHQKAYSETQNPNHSAVGFSQNCHKCHKCHSTQNWKEVVLTDVSEFVHPQTFPLTGKHNEAACADCHTNGYSKASGDCFSCHQADFTRTTTPNHAELGFSDNCQVCHSTNDWKVANPSLDGNFKHPLTFPLIGGHFEAKCDACHVSDYKNTPTACVDCHLKDFNESKNPPHAEMNFSTKCDECHSVFEWENATIPPSNLFQHPATFPITGGHRAATCGECHSNGYSNTSPECIHCHQKDLLESELDHVKYNLPQQCELCHSNQEWKGAHIPPGTGFPHPQTFPLVGGHGGEITCGECHQKGYVNTPAECNSCHHDDYVKAEPNHAELGLPFDCTQCHTIMTWKGAVIPGDFSFVHPAVFPLTEGHAGLECAKCHQKGYKNTPAACVDCHKDGLKTAEPDHVALRFGNDCTICHNRKTWKGVDLDNNPNFSHPASFPLSQGHADVSCKTCHKTGYANTPKDCWSCHQEDYDKAAPDHSGWPRNCLDCHNLSTWKNANFDHEKYFPITSGKHKLDCNQCHVYPGDYKRFECINCHEHNKSEMDDEHRGETRNYKYESRACFECHPKGRE